eukprot:gene773-885_t
MPHQQYAQFAQLMNGQRDIALLAGEVVGKVEIRVSVAWPGLTVKRYDGGFGVALNMVDIPDWSRHLIATKRIRVAAVRRLVDREMSKPARPKTPYAQLPSSTDSAIQRPSNLRDAHPDAQAGGFWRNCRQRRKTTISL